MCKTRCGVFCKLNRDLNAGYALVSFAAIFIGVPVLNPHSNQVLYN